MPRLCHRMRSKRGSYRIQRLPSSSSSPTSSTSPSSEFLTEHYPSTRSGRGRSRQVCFRSASASSATPTPHAPVPPQTAQFVLDCSLDRPRIVATVSIFFREEPILGASSTCPNGIQVEIGLMLDKQDTHRKGKAPMADDEGSRKPDCKAPAQAHELQNNDDMGEYRCFILEESPPHHDN